MQVFTDSTLIRQAMVLTDLTDCFPVPPAEIRIFECSKGELLMSPLQDRNCLMYVYSGSLSLYLLDESGHIVNVAQVENSCLLGDLELFEQSDSTVYVEAQSTTRAVAIPFSFCETQLNTNVQFLQWLCKKLLQKNQRITQIPLSSSSINDRLLFYLRYRCPDGKMSNVNTAATALHCSCRQLQRILKELTDNGTLCKLGKGVYQLME